MLTRVNECVDCAIPCVGGYCAKANALAVCCDGCGKSAELLYLLDGETLCQNCFIETVLEEAEKRTADELMDKLI